MKYFLSNIDIKLFAMILAICIIVSISLTKYHILESISENGEQKILIVALSDYKTRRSRARTIST